MNGPIWEGRIFCNPPYGRHTDLWLNEGVVTTTSARDAEVVVFLLPARTDTMWFHEYVVPYAAEVRFLKGRLKFRLGGQALDPAPFPSMVVVFRPPPTRWAVMR